VNELTLTNVPEPALRLTFLDFPTNVPVPSPLNVKVPLSVAVSSTESVTWHSV
jgi:hypothetical protein